MKTGFSLLVPAGLLFAWSAPWSCQDYTLPDGGDAGTIDPYRDGGNAGRYVADASIPVVLPAPDAGGAGLQLDSDGGITIGPSAAFNSNFVYMSNASEDTISRVVITDSGVPYEEARYYSIVPENNHGNNTASLWTNVIYYGSLTTCNQLTQSCGAGETSPSRTLVDRNGNVWVALRAPDLQAGATRLTNPDDNLGECTVRCPTRKGLAAGQVYTEGVPLRQADGGLLTLLPHAPPSGITIGNPYRVVSTKAIRPNSSEAALFACPTSAIGSSDFTDPKNYDDCVNYTISLGAPHADPDADPLGRTQHSDFGRAATIAPNCDPVSRECDVWIGMYTQNNDGTGTKPGFVHLSFNGTLSGNANPKPFDVQSYIQTPNINPYGATVDCAGILWTTPPANGSLAAISTVALTYIPDGGLPDSGLSVLPETLLTQFPSCAGGGLNYYVPNKSNACGSYGISSDQKERIWIAGYGGSNPSAACSFNGNALLAAHALFDAGAANCALVPSILASGWAAYSFASVPTKNDSNVAGATIGASAGPWTPPISRGINVDKQGNIYMGISLNGTGAVSFDPDVAGVVPCTGPACEFSAVELNWAHNSYPSTTNGSVTVGVDLDAQGNAWLNNQSSGGQGYAVELAGEANGNDGHLMNSVAVGNGPYSYSDFTGYALRYITLSRAAYNTDIPGCGVSPELTHYNTLSYSAFVPPGTDMQFDVRVVNELGAATEAAAQDFTVCDTLAHTSPKCPLLAGSTSSAGTIDLSSFNLPQGAFLVVSVTMTPLICAANGGSSPLAKPVIYHLGATDTCAGD